MLKLVPVPVLIPIKPGLQTKYWTVLTGDGGCFGTSGNKLLTPLQEINLYIPSKNRDIVCLITKKLEYPFQLKILPAQMIFYLWWQVYKRTLVLSTEEFHNITEGMTRKKSRVTILQNI